MPGYLTILLIAACLAPGDLLAVEAEVGADQPAAEPERAPTAADLQGHWIADFEVIAKLMKQDHGKDDETITALIAELKADTRGGKDVVFSGDQVAFVNGDTVVRRYRYTLAVDGAGKQRIEIEGQLGAMSRLIVLDGDSLVLRHPADGRFDLFCAYRRRPE